MEKNVNSDSIYVISEDVVAREIEGELIIIPVAAGIGDMEDELYTLNETGREIWDRLDGEKTLKKIIEELSSEYGSSQAKVEEDVMGLVEELLKRGILVEA